eukprot:17010-Chlamydomonas_euryale.AAC.1
MSHIPSHLPSHLLGDGLAGRKAFAGSSGRPRPLLRCLLMSRGSIHTSLSSRRRRPLSSIASGLWPRTGGGTENCLPFQRSGTTALARTRAMVTAVRGTAA